MTRGAFGRSAVNRAWRQAWRPPERRAIYEFAAEHITFGAESPFPGRFNVGNTPFVRTPLDALRRDDIEIVDLSGFAQSAKSTAASLFAADCVLHNPGSLTWNSPTKDAARKAADKKLWPIFRRCQPIAERIPPKSGRLTIRFPDAPVYVQTASESNAHGDTVRFQINDDVHSRHRLYRDFAHMVESAGATLHTVEAAYGERPHAVTEAGHPRHLQLKTRHELWHKENLINLGIARLPRDWRYVAWIDADVSFSRPDSVEETLQQLQHYAVVQMWTKSLDLGPNHQPFGEARSFAACHLEDVAVGSKGYGYWHSGYAWAARRGAIDTLGGLMDFCALGSADFFMAWALRGRGELADKLYHNAKRKRGEPFYSEGYLSAIAEWERRARSLRGNLGVVETTLLHHWHGKKKCRGYNSREDILIANQFDPSVDLKRDWQGLWQLADTGEHRSIVLRDKFRAYFRSRNEDSIDLD